MLWSTEVQSVKSLLSFLLTLLRRWGNHGSLRRVTAKLGRTVNNCTLLAKKIVTSWQSWEGKNQHLLLKTTDLTFNSFGQLTEPGSEQSPWSTIYMYALLTVSYSHVSRKTRTLRPVLSSYTWAAKQYLTYNRCLKNEWNKEIKEGPNMASK